MALAHLSEETRKEEYCIDSLYKCELFVREIEDLGGSAYVSKKRDLVKRYLFMKEKKGNTFFWDPLTDLLYKMDDKKYTHGEIMVRKNMPPELTEEEKKKRYITKERLIKLNENCKNEE